MRLDEFQKKYSELGKIHYEQMEYQGISIWPYIKVFLSSKKIVHQTEESAKVVKRKWSKKLLFNIVYLILFPIALWRLLLIPSNSSVIITLSHYRNKKNKLKTVHRFFEGLKKECQAEKIYCLEFIDDSMKSVALLDLDIVSLDFIFKIAKKVSVAKFQSFSRDFHKLQIIFPELQEGFDHRFQSMIIFSFLFQYFFILKKIKRVYLCPYYSEFGFAALMAATKLDIEVVDVQHGVIHRDHYAYAGVVFSEGKVLFPDKIKIWSHVEKRLILQTNSIHESSLTITGNLWLKWYSRIIELSNFKYPRAIIGNKKKKVLFTCQFNEIPNVLEEFIKFSANVFQWLIRLHPNQLNLLDQFIHNAKVRGYHNYVEIKYSSTVPLLNILNITDIHVTESSTVILDFIEYKNGKTFYINYDAEAKYEHLVGTKLFEFLDLSDFQKSINQLISSS